jgi:hypothetical protein
LGEGYLLEQSSVVKNTVGSVDQAKQLSWLLADVVGGMVDCLLVRAKFYYSATWESAMTECMPVVGSSL